MAVRLKKLRCFKAADRRCLPVAAFKQPVIPGLRHQRLAPMCFYTSGLEVEIVAAVMPKAHCIARSKSRL